MTKTENEYKIKNMGNEYIKKFDEQIKTGKGKRLLLHCCCAPCSSAVLEKLAEHFEVTVYFYNPNIQPYSEFEKRLSEQRRFIEERYSGSIAVIEAPYEKERFIKLAEGKEAQPEKGERCYLCYKLRMESAAKYAKDNGFDCFTTALSVSPHKSADFINEIGLRLEKEYKVEFIYSDFKKREGYKRSIELSHTYNLYRQDYCGCIYSKINKEQN